MKEFAIWAPSLRVINLNPQKDIRAEILLQMEEPDSFDVCVTTYDALYRVPELRQNFKWFLTVFDEAHKLKNTESIVIQLSRRL